MELLEYITKVYSGLCDEVSVTRTKDHTNASGLDIIYGVTLKTGNETAKHQFSESDLLLWQAKGILFDKLVYEE